MSVIKYRAEVDGLRAVAIIPVILFHAGFALFSGGFVGVDIFFVISGYLITSILLAELGGDRFSLISFYERRARRILPALFLVMGASSILSYFWMLPDELENYGQSMVAATLYANNILLMLTSGYWELSSEFKPLLHTWSLAVEEQYYIIFPLFLILGWRYFRRQIFWVLVGVAILSLLAAQWGSIHLPNMAFYTLPTRSWELLIGSFAAFYLRKRSIDDVSLPLRQAMSMIGMALIGVSILVYDSKTPFPSVYTLAPTIGALLIILYAGQGTIVNALLSSRPMVWVGLISYSAYLWHFPLFAFARIYSVSQPSELVFAGLAALSVLLAYLTWKYIETPFRDKNRYGRQFVFTASFVFSLAYASWGLLLHKSHGLPTRMYASNAVSSADMYIGYNEDVFKLKKNAFAHPEYLRILIQGNSFARDFVNINRETFDLSKVEIVYRDDFPLCLSQLQPGVYSDLYVSADIVVYSSGSYKKECINDNVSLAKRHGKRLFYVGNKHFGFNLNWLVRLSPADRVNRYNPLLKEIILDEEETAMRVPRDNFIPILEPVVQDGQVPITDSFGRLITADRRHLTRQGAIFFGEKSVAKSIYGQLVTAHK